LTLPTPLGDGPYSWYVYANDAASNSTASVARKLTIDTLRPDEFRLSSPPDGSCTSVPTPSLCWNSAADTNGIGSHKLYIDNVLAVTATSSCSTPPSALSQGPHSWYVVQTDRAGNLRQSSDTRQVWIDYTAPTAPALSAPANAATLVDPPLFVWTAGTDNIAIKSYELYVDGTLTATLDSSALTYLQQSELALGNHTWYVRALDRCGNAAQTSAASFTMQACTPDGAQHPCPGYNLGACKPGTRTCTLAGTFSACTGAVAPVNEICDGIDNNCDGIVDNSTPGVPDNQCGGVCSITPPYIWSPCDGPDADQCQEGHLACDGINATVCVETTPNNVEVCNGRDDDCNGVVDDAGACSQAGAGGTTGTGGQTSTGGATLVGGGTAGTTGVRNGGTGGLIAATGGQVSVTRGGTNGTSGSSSVTPSSGGVSASAGGTVAVALGGSAGVTSVVLGEGGATTAVAGQVNLATAGGNTAVTSSGGTNASGAMALGTRAGAPAAGLGNASTNHAAGFGNGSNESNAECDCRMASSGKGQGTWTLVCGLALLALGRKRRRCVQ